MADDWRNEPAARDPVPPGHGQPQRMDDPDWDLVVDPDDPKEEEDDDRLPD